MPIESGFRIVIKGFVPTDSADIDGQITALQAVKAATAPGGDIGALKDVMRVEEVQAKPVDRRAKSEAVEAE